MADLDRWVEAVRQEGYSAVYAAANWMNMDIAEVFRQIESFLQEIG